MFPPDRWLRTLPISELLNLFQNWDNSGVGFSAYEALFNLLLECDPLHLNPKPEELLDHVPKPMSLCKALFSFTSASSETGESGRAPNIGLSYLDFHLSVFSESWHISLHGLICSRMLSNRYFKIVISSCPLENWSKLLILQNFFIT